MGRVTRELFFKPDSALFQQFDVDGANFGSYLSKESHGFRLKLDVKPMNFTIQEGGTEERQEDRIQFAFNFHADLPDNPAAQIQVLLTRWNDINLEAQAIVETVTPRG
jgi:hypothetical protein